MLNTLLNFLKKNWLYVLLVCIVFFIGFKLFYSNKSIDTLNQSVIEKEYENKLLKQQLTVQKATSDSLKKVTDVLYEKLKSTSTIKVINNIKNKNEKERTYIINANNDEQFIIFSSWLSKENSNR